MTGDEKAVAWEEAAHAVMMLSIGREFKYATIKPEGRYRGHVEPRDQKITNLWELVGALEVLCAGSIAQAHLRNKPATIEQMRGLDRQQITRLLKENENTISRNESPHFMQWVFFRAHMHLTQRFKLVERIATALQATRTLSYEECKELMNETGERVTA